LAERRQHASRLRRRLKNALDEAVAASGGQPVTVNQAVDVTETCKTTAIRQLARDEQFQAGVRADRGIKFHLDAATYQYRVETLMENGVVLTYPFKVAVPFEELVE
jgi:hypothetical protein